jgi:hypothetical protein
MTTLSFILLTIPFILPVAAIYSAGELIRRRRLRLDAPPTSIAGGPAWIGRGIHRFPREFENVIANPQSSCRAQDVRGFNALVAAVRGYKTSSNHSEIPVTAVRAVVRILMFARLIRMRAGR